MDVLATFLILMVTVVSATVIWFSLPGGFLLLAFIFIWSWLGGFAMISLGELLVLLGILLLLEVLEFALGGLVAGYTGAEKRSAWLAVAGGFLGTIILGSLFFVVGAVLGLFLGSWLGAYWGERQAGKSVAEARRAALGALLGSVAAKMIKSTATVIMGVWMIREVI